MGRGSETRCVKKCLIFLVPKGWRPVAIIRCILLSANLSLLFFRFSLLKTYMLHKRTSWQRKTVKSIHSTFTHTHTHHLTFHLLGDIIVLRLPRFSTTCIQLYPFYKKCLKSYQCCSDTRPDLFTTDFLSHYFLILISRSMQNSEDSQIELEIELNLKT